MNKRYLYLPENLDIKSIIALAPHQFYTENLQEQNLLYICSAIIKARKSQRKKMLDDRTRYANVCSEQLDMVVHNYNKYFEYLLKNKVIETDNHFILGEKCRGYCFLPPYRGQKLKRVEVSSYRLRKGIRRAAEAYKKEQKKALMDHLYLTKWWDEPGLEIDLKGAIEWIEEYRDLKLNSIYDEAVYKEMDASELEYEIDNLADTCEDFKLHVESIYMGEFNYEFSGLGHRFYNPISNLKKEQRAFLTYKGQPLVELDKKNSQPYFSLALLKKSFWGRPSDEPYTLNINNLFGNGKNRRRLGDGGCIPGIDAIITLLENEETQASKGFGGFQKYIDCVTDDFYQHIEDIFKPRHPDRFNDRSQVKIEVMRILYMDPLKDHLDFYLPCKTFEVHFPSVYRLFTKIKEVDYTYLSIILQRIESFLFLEVICKRINEQYPYIPLFTIHDCILTTKGNEYTVKAIIEEELLRWIGYPATLHCKEVTAMQENEHGPVKSLIPFSIE